MSISLDIALNDSSTFNEYPLVPLINLTPLLVSKYPLTASTSFWALILFNVLIQVSLLKEYLIL